MYARIRNTPPETPATCDVQAVAPCVYKNPFTAPGFVDRSRLHLEQRQLFDMAFENTPNKDVWSSDTPRISLLEDQLREGWTVFQRRTFAKTPVLWMTNNVI